MLNYLKGYNITAKEIGANIVRARKAQGLSREKFADKNNISVVTLYSTEHGKHYPRESTLVMIADGLGVSMERLLGVQHD